MVLSPYAAAFLVASIGSIFLYIRQKRTGKKRNEEEK